MSIIAIMCKNGIIHAIESTRHIATPAEEDRFTAICNIHTRFDEDWGV